MKENEIIYIWDYEFGSYDLDQLQLEDYKAMITDYCYESYSWTGIAIAITTYNIWHKFHLWHCSCYWPIEHWYTGKFTTEEIRELIKNYEWNYYLSESKNDINKDKFIDFIKNYDNK